MKAMTDLEREIDNLRSVLEDFELYAIPCHSDQPCETCKMRRDMVEGALRFAKTLGHKKARK